MSKTHKPLSAPFSLPHTRNARWLSNRQLRQWGSNHSASSAGINNCWTHYYTGLTRLSSNHWITLQNLFFPFFIIFFFPFCILQSHVESYICTRCYYELRRVWSIQIWCMHLLLMSIIAWRTRGWRKILV